MAKACVEWVSGTHTSPVSEAASLSTSPSTLATCWQQQLHTQLRDPPGTVVRASTAAHWLSLIHLWGAGSRPHMHTTHTGSGRG
jgi:hypothetical protein